MRITLKKFDEELQVVYGEVYTPNMPDSQGDFMTEVEVMKMAHKYLANMNTGTIDLNHDHADTQSVVVESFIAQKNDPMYLEGSWVVGVHIPNEDIWEDVKSGELNGFSYEGLVTATKKMIEIEVPEEINGYTSKVEDHVHKFQVKFAEDGTYLGGQTNFVDGHAHTIQKGTITDKGGLSNHTHRYSFTEEIMNG